MDRMNIGVLKKNFSKVIEDVRNGKEYLVVYGRSEKPVAVISPVEKKCKNRDVLNLPDLFRFAEHDSQMTEEEFLGLL